MTEQNSGINSPHTDSSYSIDDTRIIDEREITEQEIERLQAISISGQLEPKQYPNYRLTNVQHFKTLYSQINVGQHIESGVKPGEITALTFATQIRNIHLEAVLETLKRGQPTTIYSGTIGYPTGNWQKWIKTVRDEQFSDIFESFNQWQSTDPITREHTPVGFKDYIKQKDSITVGITTSQPAWSTFNSTFSPETIDVPQEHSSQVEEDDESTLFLNTTSEASSILPSLTGEDENSDLVMHSRIMDHSLKQLHSVLQLNVVFTDLYLNTIHILCEEYSKLLEQGNKLTRLFKPGDHEVLIVYRMLRMFAMSSQPPFNAKALKLWRPVLHLELFFTNLISPEETKIKDPIIQLKYYTEGKTLTADRYAVMSRDLFKVRDSLYNTHGVTTPTKSKLEW